MNNKIGDAGVWRWRRRRGRARYAAQGTLAHSNQIGDAGVTALAEAAKARCRSSVLASLQPIGDAGVMALARRRGRARCAAQELWLKANSTISQQAQDTLKAACPTVMCASEARSRLNRYQIDLFSKIVPTRITPAPTRPPPASAPAARSPPTRGPPPPRSPMRRPRPSPPPRGPRRPRACRAARGRPP